MPPAKKALTVSMPRTVAHEVADVAARTQRSVAFIARRALSAAPPDAPLPAMTELESLALTTDEDDPPDTVSKLKAAATSRCLDEALAAAWVATRDRFKKWLEREESAQQAERADDLDAGLRAAADPATAVDRLVVLGSSEYPKIRALVAAHPKTPAEVLGRLAQDREPYVRDAVENRRLKG